MNKFQDIKSFTFFIGYPRSGHSLLGACLDAHPNAIISHELDALALIKNGMSRDNLFEAILKKSKAFYKDGSQWSGYAYRIPGMWQGSFESLEVIGDKRGGGSAKHLEDDNSLLEKVKVLAPNYKMIHVVKNPFDCISTSIQKQEQIQERIFSKEDHQRKIEEFFSRAKTISAIIKKEPDHVSTIRYENLIREPGKVLTELCSYLGLVAREDYINACASIIWPTGRPSRQRSGIWESSLIHEVQIQIEQFDFFKGYTFHSE
ncbi:MAG TPA: sulfotransferase [Bacteroidia bacterium]|nr:sulfotransferase [Bacteroidia bacterium]